jgi:PLP dependent protein
VTLSTGTSIAENAVRVRERIAEAARRAGRDPAEITLVAISKTQPVTSVIEAVKAGLVHIGENRVQEAAEKLVAARAALGDVRFVGHMVGHLQTNKAGLALDVFDRIDAVDSVKLAQALSRRAAGRVIPVLLEVYVGDDAARPGLRLAELSDAVGQIAELPGVRIEGLMTVAPLGGDSRAAFSQVREAQNVLVRAYPDVHFGVLSMGMSEDFEAAIQEGSTEIRIGTALFGPRQLR